MLIISNKPFQKKIGKILPKFFLLTFLFLINSQSIIVNCQLSIVNSFSSRHYGLREGLPQLEIMTMFQDDNGYLWLDCAGVSRFDGRNFVNYSMKDLQINSYIMKIFQYKTDIVLVSLNKIVYIYPDQTMEFYPYPDNYRMLNNIVETNDSAIYLFNCMHVDQKTPEYFIFKFDLESKTFTKIAEGLPYLYANTIDQKIYAITGREISNQQLQLYRIDNDTVKIINSATTEKKDEYLCLVKNTKKNEWFGTINKEVLGRETFHFYQYYIENDSLKWKYLAQTPAFVTGMAQWDENRVILGFEENTPTLALNMETLELYTIPLNINAVRNIYEDRDKNFWFATMSGLFILPRFLFEYYQLDLNNQNLISSVLKDSHQNIWFSIHNNGHWRVDKHGKLHKITLIHNQKEISYYTATELYEYSRGRVILPSWTGFVIYDPEKNNPNRLELIITGMAGNSYYDVENEDIYFSRWEYPFSSLNILHSDGSLSSYLFDYKFINFIVRDANRKLRIGTYHGIYFFDEENHTFEADTVARPYKSVICMALDNQGTFWKGGWDGFFAEDKNGNDRIISDQVTTTSINYHNRYIIFGSKNTLNILDLQDFYQENKINIRTLGFFDGFDVASTGHLSIDNEGYVWLAGGDRAIHFLPDEIMKIPLLQPSKPALSAIYYAGRNREWKLTHQTASISLKNKENSLRFDILQASLSAPDKLVFRYKLNGFNDKWLTSYERSLYFQNLSFGKYQLEVQSSVDNGEMWSESLFSPIIIIKNPFLLTLPGIIILILVISGIVALIIYFTHKISIRKAEKQKLIEQLKYKAVRAKFIPHFTGNVLNSINFLITENSLLAKKYIADFSDFSQQTLINSDTMLQTIKEELEYTELYLKLEKLRFKNKFDYEFLIEDNVNLQIMIPVMIFQTFCENAIKHGLFKKTEGGKIKVQIRNEENYVVLSVEDNGIGRKMAKAYKTGGTGEGLKIINQQLNIYNKGKQKQAYMKIIDLEDNKGLAAGTRFEIWLQNNENLTTL